MSHPEQTPGGVRFRYTGAASIHSVAVAGTFNHWVGDDRPLTRIDASTWETVLPITPGRHLYKFVIDGRDWVTDPHNDWISEDAQNNSCFTVYPDCSVMVRDGALSAERPTALHREHAALRSPDWLRDAVIYEAAVSAFTPAGTFNAMRAHLPYLTDLGVTVLWLMPIHPVGVARRSGTRGDPYAVRDFAAIDPALGNAADFAELVRACHAAGLRVIMDWTLNRASCDSPLTRAHPEWFTRKPNGAMFYAVPNRDAFAGYDFTNRELRACLISAMRRWVTRFDIDGFRFDDSDLTPLDFLEEIRAALQEIRPDIGLISQSYDELHHLAACDLTYEGGMRDLIARIAAGEATADDVRREWEAATYSFPRGALRMRWLEEKEQGRAFRFFGRALHHAAAAILMTLDGVPFVLMGQEFNEPGWRNWTSLFEPWQLDWRGFDAETFAHYKALIALRREHAALRSPTVTFVDAGHPQLLQYWRGAPESGLRVTVNLTRQPLPHNPTGRTTHYAFPAVPPGVVAAFGCVIDR